MNLKAAPGNKTILCTAGRYDRADKSYSGRKKGEVMTEVPKEWKGTPEEWNAVVEAFGRIAKAIQEAGRQIVNSFSEFYKKNGGSYGKRTGKETPTAAVHKRQKETIRTKPEAAAVGSSKYGQV